MDKMLEKIEECANLPKNWGHDASIPTKPEITKAAKELHAMASKFGLYGNAFPWSNGNLNMCYYVNLNTEDVTCTEIELHLINGNIEMYLCVEKGYGSDYTTLYEKDDATLEDVENALYCMKNRLGRDWY